MLDEQKTRQQLIGELERLRQQLAELESQPPVPKAPVSQFITDAGTGSLAGREVSCRAVGIFFQKLEQQHLPPERLLRGVSYPLSFLLNKHERIDWTTFRTLMANAGKVWSDEVLVQIGRSWVQSPWARPFAVVARLLFTAGDFYRWAARPNTGGSNQLLSCLHMALDQIGPDHLLLEVMMRPGYEPCRELHLVSKGGLVATPGVLGLGDAVVHMEELASGVRYDIQYPAGGGALAWLRRIITRPLTVRAAAQELREANEALQSRYQELEEQIAERKQSDRALQESERRFRALVEASFEGIAISIDGTIVEANQALAAMFDYEVAEVIGKTPYDLVTPESAERIMRQISAKAETMYEVTGIKRGGETFTIELVGKNCMYKGKPARVTGFRDVSEHRRAEQALRESEQRFRQLAENIDEIFWLLSPDEQELLYINSAYERISGYSRERLYANPSSWLEAVYPEDRDIALALTREDSAGVSKDERSGEYRYFRADGSIRWVWVRSHPVLDETGNVISRVGIAVDVTERKHVEEALRRTQKLESLGVLAGGVAHDFNNLLVAMMAQTSLALAKLSPDNPARAHVEKAIHAAEKAAKLTRQMLAYSGRGQFEIQLINLNLLIQDNLHLFEAAVPKYVTLRSRLSTSLPTIEGDPGQMQQVVMNLILNAAEAIGDRPGEVVVTTTITSVNENDWLWQYTGEPLAPGRYVTLEVRDNGAGMDESTLAKIFDPFFTTKATGRGLGLAAVLGIVRGHKGGLHVSSESGRGTTFKLLFPAQDNRVASLPAPPPVIQAQPAESGLVLVIDDEEPVREAVTDILEMEGISVITAADGTAGIGLFEEKVADIRLVLLDLSMPGLSGIDTLQALQVINPSVPVILSSGYSEVEVVDRLTTKSKAAFLQKPYDQTRLVEVIRQQLSGRPK